MFCFILTADLQINVLKFVSGHGAAVSLLQLISHLDKNKHSNIVEHHNRVLSELSIGVHRMLNRIGRMCISL